MCPTSIHDQSAQHIAFLITEHLRAYPEIQEHADWRQSFSQVLSYESKQSSRGIPDFTIYKDPSTPYLIVEIALSQQGDEAEAKCERWMHGRPSIVGAIVINIEEESGSVAPKLAKGQRYHAPTKTEWDKQIADCDPLGPIVVNGHTWFRAGTCSVEVLISLNDEVLAQECVSHMWFSVYLYSLFL